MSDNISYKKFLQLLKEGEIDAAVRYKNEFVPDKIYKFMNLPEDRDELCRRIEQIIQGKIWLSKKKALNDIYELEMIDFSKFSPEEKQYYDTNINELELTCFTREIKNQAMWGYYANGKYGICIEYVVKNKNNLYPVEYIKEKRDYATLYKRFYLQKEQLAKNLNIQFPQSPSQIGSCLVKALQSTFCFKDFSWAHEKEIRVVSKKVKTQLEEILDEDFVNDYDEKGSLHNLDDFNLRISKIWFLSQKDSASNKLCNYICEKISKNRYEKCLSTIPKITYDEFQSEIKAGIFLQKYEAVVCCEQMF